MAILITGQNATIYGELYRTDINGVLLEDLTEHVIDGFVEWHGDRSDGTPMTCSFTMKTPNLLTPWVDYITPYMNITYNDDRAPIRERCGVFLVMPYAESHTPNTSEVVVTGRDLTYLLSTSQYLDTQNFATGANVVTCIRSIITSVGITKHNIRNSSRTLGYDRSYTFGTTKRDAANKLAQAIGYYRLFMDRSGYIRSSPYQKLSTLQPAKVYTEADLIETLEVDAPPIDQFANVVTLKKDDPTNGSLYAIAREDNPAVPWSTVALGRTIVRPLELVSDVETQDDIDKLAEQRLQNAGAFEKVLNVTTLPDPFQEINRCVDLFLTGEKDYLNGRYRLRGWKMGFTPDTASVSLELNRVATFVSGVLIPGQGLSPV